MKVLRINLSGPTAWIKIIAFYFLICVINFATILVLKMIPLVKKILIVFGCILGASLRM